MFKLCPIAESQVKVGKPCIGEENILRVRNIF